MTPDDTASAAADLAARSLSRAGALALVASASASSAAAASEVTVGRSRSEWYSVTASAGGVVALNALSVARGLPLALGLNTRTMIALLPPLRKKSRTAKPSLLSIHRPPNCCSNSSKLKIVAGWFTGPRSARPRNAVVAVSTGTIVRTSLASSWM